MSKFFGAPQILPSDFQINPAYFLRDCEPGAVKLGNRFLDSEKFCDGDYDCNRNHDHERAKNACE